MFRRPLLAVLAATTTLIGAGCTTGEDAAQADPTVASETATSSSAPPSSGESAPPSSPAAPQASTVEGPCPYLDQDFVENTIGQQLGTVLVTTTTPATGPLPKCEFQRYNGESGAIIDTLTIADGEGLTTALELVPGGNPVTAGEGGSVLVHQGQDRTDLAAFAGTTLVTVTINQESSLEATELANEVLAQVG